MRRWSRWWVALVLCSFAGLGLAQQPMEEIEIEARLKRDITLLASDEFEGRGVGTKGLELASEYIVDQFTKSGLKPGGIAGTYFQPFPFNSGSELDGVSTITLHGPEGKQIELDAKDFAIIGFSGAGKVMNVPLVFVGYGATAKEIGYDDYQGIDVEGKIVVAIRRLPRWNDKERPFDGTRKDSHASLDTKQARAESHKALGMIVINDASELPGDNLMAFGATARAASESRLPFVNVKRKVLDDVIQASLGKPMEEIDKAIDKDLKPQSAPLVGWSASLEVKVKRKSVEVKNVVGVLEGSGPLAKETVVIGAHYDHLGFGGPGSLAKDKSKQIHHGADDNGSGTTTLLEIARHYGAMKDRVGRRLVFITFTAEESGLIGSRYYTKKQPLFPIEDTVAMVNLDMVGRLRPDAETKKDKVLIEGSGTAKNFDALLEKLNPGFTLKKKAGGNGPSDHDSFYSAKIPVIFFWTGMHEDYHRPSDTADKINVAGMRRIAEYAYRCIDALTVEPRPEYVQVASVLAASGPKGPRLGIMPDYESTIEGLLVSAVSKDGPAEKAGLKDGDVIVDIGGRQITNVNTYMVVMSQQKSGQTIEITVLREGKKLQLKALPQ